MRCPGHWRGTGMAVVERVLVRETKQFLCHAMACSRLAMILNTQRMSTDCGQPSLRAGRRIFRERRPPAVPEPKSFHAERCSPDIDAHGVRGHCNPRDPNFQFVARVLVSSTAQHVASTPRAR